MTTKRTTKNNTQPAWKPGDSFVRHFDDIDPDEFKAFWGQTDVQRLMQDASNGDGAILHDNG